jgi:hypothetical protein
MLNVDKSSFIYIVAVSFNHLCIYYTSYINYNNYN